MPQIYVYPKYNLLFIIVLKTLLTKKAITISNYYAITDFNK